MSLLAGLPASGLGQGMDYELTQLHPVTHTRTRTVDPSSVSATVRAASDGSQLLLYIHVRDQSVNLHRDPMRTDHVELWVALPRSAYPDDFEYQFHPHYILGPGHVTRDQSVSGPRIFSLYSEYANRIDLPSFVDAYAYRQFPETQVPPPHNLTKEEVHFGMLRFALFPDERPAILLNQDHLRRVEESLGIELGDMASRITYQVVWEQQSGYEISVQLPPEAMGFVTLPSMEESNIVVDIMDTPLPGRRAISVLSTQPSRKPGTPDDFQTLRFQVPLTTNYTTVSDALFDKTHYHPICVYTTADWIPTGVDVDALVYQEQEASAALTEVRFSPQPFQHHLFNHGGVSVETLEVDMEFVNELAIRKGHTLVKGQVVSAAHIRTILSEPSNVHNTIFQFPDGEIGLILRSNTTVDPYGWGDCGTCIEETISIHKVSEDRVRDLLYIQQGDGPNAYCQIKDLIFDHYYIERIDWIKEGEILVLRLNHRFLTDKKRVKVSWNPEGQNLAVEQIR